MRDEIRETLTGYADANRIPVLAYVPQLCNLLQQIFENITNLQALKVLYKSTNPLISAFAFSQFLGPVFLLASEVKKNSSQVDRWWTLLPLNIWWNEHDSLFFREVTVSHPTRNFWGAVTNQPEDQEGGSHREWLYADSDGVSGTLQFRPG
ncbi:hypothetical protein JMJ35_003060 [Cladonia borealis]|uniref:Uncharacterized protein n=1 Tax=Cladonia borealis TaxID=184061 RepID=A0AA39R3Z9_9LECA|nr:hypothetical protein JMJ35_003060 [Cladonia borealis]